MGLGEYPATRSVPTPHFGYFWAPFPLAAISPLVHCLVSMALPWTSFGAEHKEPGSSVGYKWAGKLLMQGLLAAGNIK